jgi:hypothetical protein
MFGLQQPRHISTLPKAAIIGIRLERQLSEDKLPSAAIVHDGRR